MTLPGKEKEKAKAKAEAEAKAKVEIGPKKPIEANEIPDAAPEAQEQGPQEPQEPAEDVPEGEEEADAFEQVVTAINDLAQRVSNIEATLFRLKNI
jgi:hypothetical protein